MDPPNDAQIFVDMDREQNYSDFDKQHILASILNKPTDNSVEIEVPNIDNTEVQSQPQNDLILESTGNKEIKESKPRIKCPECQRFTTDDEEKMVRHIRKVHLGQNPFQCSYCDYSTYNKAVFEEHVRVHMGIKPFKCAYCPYRSASKKNKNKHELIHRKNNPLKCDQCPFIAHHYRSLVCHKQKHENGSITLKEEDIDTEELKCDVCSFTFPTEIALKRHKTNNKRRICQFCNARFCSNYYMKKHMTICHDVKNDMFVCDVCGWAGALKMKVLLHLVHHPHQEIDENTFDVSVLRKHGIIR